MTGTNAFAGRFAPTPWIVALLTRSAAVLTGTMWRTTRVVAAMALFGMAAGAEAQTGEKPEQIAAKAYVYGLQQPIYYGQRWTYTQNDRKDNIVYAGLNQFSWVRKQITPDYPVVTPNATTLYGAGVELFSASFTHPIERAEVVFLLREASSDRGNSKGATSNPPLRVSSEETSEQSTAGMLIP